MSSQTSRRTWSLAYIHQNHFKEMIKKKVWRKFKKENIPPNRCLIDSKLVFKKKSEGQFRARLVARGAHPNYRSRLHLELITSGHWPQTFRNTTYVVDQQVGLTEYRRWNIVFICSTIGRNLHEDTRRNVRSNWRELHVRVYFDTNKIYPRSLTSRMLLSQGIHQYNYPQIGTQAMNYLP